MRRWTANENAKPPCFVRHCPASDVQHDELAVWLSVFRILKSEVFAGQALQILEKAGALESDYEVFATLDAELASWRKIDLERKRQTRK